MFHTPLRTPRLAAWCIALSALIAAAPDTQAAILSVGASGCTHTTIQAAVNAAEASAGADTIRITRSLAYTAQQVVVNTAQDLNIVGGFADCAASASDGQKTVISGAGGGATSVFALANSGVSTIKLRLLRITDGDAPGDGYGGGINFNGTGTLEIIESAIDSNHAGYGGGIYFAGTGNDATLIIGNDNLINGNTAGISGGGIYLGRAEMLMTAPGSSIYGNTAANFGGGLRLYGSASGTKATVGSSGYSNFGAIDGNQASYGGGVAVQGLEDDGSGTSDFVLQAPGRISYNFASASGGAIYLQNYRGVGDYGDVTAVVSGGDLDTNVAPQAAAVFVGHDSDFAGNARGSQFSMNGGRMVGNLSLDGLNQATNGSIVVASEFGRAFFDHVVIQDNEGGSILRGDTLENNLPARLNHCLVTDNILREPLVNVLNSGSIDIVGTTIAGNTLGNTPVLAIANNINLQRSIIWQPGKSTLQIGGTRDIADVIASETASLAGDSTVIGAAPRFIDPAHRDYHLQAASPAVDFSATPGVDLALVPNRFGSGDLGAYERQDIGNLALNPGFIQDLRLWDVVTAGVSSWISTGANSAGSVLITLTPVPVIGEPLPTGPVIGLSQCVHIPGPGIYRLSGFAYGLGSSFERDMASLAWKFRSNPGVEACAGATTSEGTVTFPDSATFAASPPPDIIEVTPAQWSRYSSVEVSLLVREGGFDFYETRAGYFDGVVLEETTPPLLPDPLFSNGFE